MESDGMEGREFMKRLSNPHYDPLPKEEQTRRWFVFAHDDKQFLNVIDPANVPAPNDKVDLLLAWTAYRWVDGKMGEKARNGIIEEKKIQQMPVDFSCENMARLLNELRGAVKAHEVYLAWHRFWEVRLPDEKLRKVFAKAIPDIEAEIARVKSGIATLMELAEEHGKELPTVQ
jgi:hypothetical protein